MAGEIIRQGDPTNHGGTVLEGSLVDICHGKPISYIGHKVSCPQCKGTYPIVEGVQTTTFYGKGVALAGMKTACGATLIATQFTDIVEVGGGGAPAASDAAPAVLMMASAAPAASSASATNQSPAGATILAPQKNGGVMVSPPTQKEIDVAIKHQPPFELEKRMFLTRAINEKKLRVVREGNNVTLTGTLSIFSAGGADKARQFIADVNARFQGHSHTSEKLTYRTAFAFTVAPQRGGTDIIVDYQELPKDRAHGVKNGQIILDQSADFKQIRPGVGAHEFAHSILGVPDGYYDITLSRPEGPYYLTAVPHREQKDSLMCDVSKRIPGPDLKTIILKLESQLKGTK